MSRILRTLVCMLLICCILVNLSPLKVNASAAGALGIVKATSVAIPGLWPIAACLAVVGIAAGIDSGAFENVANNCFGALEAAGTWIDNGMAHLLRTEDDLGNVSYYVDGGMIEDVRSWIFDTNVVGEVEVSTPTSASSAFRAKLEDAKTKAYAVMIYFSPDNITLATSSSSPFVFYSSGSDLMFKTKDGSSFAYYNALSGSSWWDRKSAYYDAGSTITYFGTDYLGTNYDLSLGYLPPEDIELDDATIVTFHPYLADVIRTRSGGSGDSGNDQGDKWWLGLHFAETLEKLYETTQQTQIETPSVTEIPDLQEGTQYEVTVETDEDGNERYVLSPIYNPGTGDGTDPDTGTDTDPDTGTDSGNGSGDNTGTDSGNPGNGGTTSAPSSPPSQFALADLSKFFPFCIPFDLFDFFQLLNADPVAPVFNWEIQDLAGQTYGITIDLSEWDPVAQLFRRLQLFLFVCGLAAASRKYIKW